MNRITDADVMQPICTHKISVKFDAVARIPDYQVTARVSPTRWPAATIYKTTHNGGLAFLVIPNVKASNGLKSGDIYDTSLYTAEVGRSNRLEPICFCNSFSDRTQQCSLLELSKSRQLSLIGDGDITERHCKTEEGACIPRKASYTTSKKVWLWGNAADISLSSWVRHLHYPGMFQLPTCFIC